LLGILSEFAKVNYTDARNRQAIAACRQIEALHLNTGARW